MKKITQDRSKCIGCMACVGLNPDLFTMAADGLAELQNAQTQEGVLVREVDDDVDTATLVSACCGGAIGTK